VAESKHFEKSRAKFPGTPKRHILSLMKGRSSTRDDDEGRMMSRKDYVTTMRYRKGFLTKGANEETEVNEISKDLLKRYRKKADVEIDSDSVTGNKRQQRLLGSFAAKDRLDALKRKKPYDKAVERAKKFRDMTKESAEVNEVSRSTLWSYREKAGKQVRDYGDQRYGHDAKTASKVANRVKGLAKVDGAFDRLHKGEKARAKKAAIDKHGTEHGIHKSGSFVMRHYPGKNDDEYAKLKADNKGSGHVLKKYGRLGKDNPNAGKYKTGKSNAYQYIHAKDAAHFDVYKRKVHEEETLSEISKRLAGRYINAAHQSGLDAEQEFAHTKDQEARAGLSNKQYNREFGIKRAVRKLVGRSDVKIKATESVEVDEQIKGWKHAGSDLMKHRSNQSEVNEVSSNLIRRYIDKARRHREDHITKKFSGKKTTDAENKKYDKRGDSIDKAVRRRNRMESVEVKDAEVIKGAKREGKARKKFLSLSGAPTIPDAVKVDESVNSNHPLKRIFRQGRRDTAGSSYASNRDTLSASEKRSVKASRHGSGKKTAYEKGQEAGAGYLNRNNDPLAKSHQEIKEPRKPEEHGIALRPKVYGKNTRTFYRDRMANSAAKRTKKNLGE
jgi:hypothetical protein